MNDTTPAAATTTSQSPTPSPSPAPIQTPSASVPTSHPEPSAADKAQIAKDRAALVDAAVQESDQFDEVDEALFAPKTPAEDEIGQAQEVPGAAPGAQAPAPTVDPAAPPQPAPGTPEVPPGTPPGATPPVTQPAATTTETPPQPLTPEQRSAAIAEYRKGAEEKLTGFFALGKEEAEELVADPAKVVPKLMGRVLLQTVEATVAAVQHWMPGYLANLEVQRGRVKEYEDKFFEAWPQLDRKAHREAIDRAANFYRSMHPAAKPDELIRDVGAQVMVALKINPNATPSATQAHSPGAPVQQPIPPHRPAVASAPRAAPGEGPTKNFFQQMADDDAAGRFADD